MGWPPSFFSHSQQQPGWKRIAQHNNSSFSLPLATGEQQQRMGMGGRGGTCQTFRAAFFCFANFCFSCQDCKQSWLSFLSLLCGLNNGGRRSHVSFRGIVLLYSGRLLPHTPRMFLLLHGEEFYQREQSRSFYSLWGLKNWEQASMAARFAFYVHRGWRSERWAADHNWVTHDGGKHWEAKHTLGLRKAGRHFGFCNRGRRTRRGTSDVLCCMDGSFKDGGGAGWRMMMVKWEEVGWGGGMLSRKTMMTPWCEGE